MSADFSLYACVTPREKAAGKAHFARVNKILSQHSAISIQHSAFSIQHSALSNQHSAISIQQSAFSNQHSAMKPFWAIQVIHLAASLRRLREDWGGGFSRVRQIG
jgi:hypothetical protein